MIDLRPGGANWHKYRNTMYCRAGARRRSDLPTGEPDGGPEEADLVTEIVEIEPQGPHQFVVRLRDREETAEAWFTLSPAVLDDLGPGADDEADLVRRTVTYLLGHQDVADFPSVVELEDVLATYDDYRDTIRSSAGR